MSVTTAAATSTLTTTTMATSGSQDTSVIGAGSGSPITSQAPVGLFTAAAAPPQQVGFNPMANSTMRAPPVVHNKWRRRLNTVKPFFIVGMWIFVVLVVIFCVYHLVGMFGGAMRIVGKYHEMLLREYETAYQLSQFVATSGIIIGGLTALYFRFLAGEEVEEEVYYPPVARRILEVPVVPVTPPVIELPKVEESKPKKKVFVCTDNSIAKGLRHYGGTEPWGDFQSHFDLTAITAGWGEEEQRVRLILTLRTTAAGYMGGIPEEDKDTLKKVVDLLTERFGPHKEKEIYIAEAQFRRKRKDENYRELGQAIEELLRKAYPGCPSAVSSLGLRYFKENCGVGAIQEYIALKNPQTVTEAATVAQSWKDVMKPLQDKRTEQKGYRGGNCNAVNPKEPEEVAGQKGRRGRGRGRGSGGPNRGRGGQPTNYRTLRDQTGQQGKYLSGRWCFDVTLQLLLV